MAHKRALFTDINADLSYIIYVIHIMDISTHLRPAGNLGKGKEEEEEGGETILSASSRCKCEVSENKKKLNPSVINV